jgi:hypothetical protein
LIAFCDDFSSRDSFATRTISSYRIGTRTLPQTAMSSAVAELDNYLQSMLALKAPGVSGSKINSITSLCTANVQVLARAPRLPPPENGI